MTLACSTISSTSAETPTPSHWHSDLGCSPPPCAPSLRTLSASPLCRMVLCKESPSRLSVSPTASRLWTVTPSRPRRRRRPPRTSGPIPRRPRATWPACLRSAIRYPRAAIPRRASRAVRRYRSPRPRMSNVSQPTRPTTLRHWTRQRSNQWQAALAPAPVVGR